MNGIDKNGLDELMKNGWSYPKRQSGSGATLDEVKSEIETAVKDKAKVHCSTTEPENLSPGDIWLRVVEQ